MNGWTIGIGAVAILIIIYLLTTRGQSSQALAEGPTTLGHGKIATGGYKNTQTFSLSNFDPDTFMPRTITVHREVKPL